MKKPDKKLHDLMYGLLYPAILGAGIVLLVTYGIQVGLCDIFLSKDFPSG
jgi:hypothetical protein